MAETAAHLVDQVIPRVPVRQWVLSFPIPLRFLLAAHPHLLSPILGVINRAISTFLTKQAGLTRAEAQTGAVTLIQRFGSAATKSPGAILNNRRLARRAEGRMPGVIHATPGRPRPTSQAQSDSVPRLIAPTLTVVTDNREAILGVTSVK